MNTKSNLDLRSYLQTIVLSTLKDEHVVPPKEAAKQIEEEIKRKTTIEPACLSVEDFKGEVERTDKIVFSANPSTFTEDSLTQVLLLAKILKEQGAKKFQVVFANRQCKDNMFGDKVFLAARYVKR